MDEFTLSLNGHLVQTQARTLQALLMQQGYALDAAMACAVNQSFVPRLRWPDHLLNANDRSRGIGRSLSLMYSCWPTPWGWSPTCG